MYTAGIYYDLNSPNQPEFSAAEKANEKIEGKQDTSYNEDGLRTIFEIYTSLDMGEEDLMDLLLIF